MRFAFPTLVALCALAGCASDSTSAEEAVVEETVTETAAETGEPVRRAVAAPGDTVAHAPPRQEPKMRSGLFPKPGYETYEDEGRLWVFRAGSPELVAFRTKGEPAKIVVLPLAGPAGMTLKAPDNETALGYLAHKDGFVTRIEDGRLWVFRRASKHLAKYDAGGEPAKRVIRPRAGPLGATVKAVDADVIEEYLSAKAGFETRHSDGRLWVFRAGSADVADYDAGRELVKHVVLPGAGPLGRTLKGPDKETLADYMAAQEGFETIIDDGRIWVFHTDSAELYEFRTKGEPAKRVIRPSAGPLGMTVQGPDSRTIDLYLRCAR